MQETHAADYAQIYRRAVKRYGHLSVLLVRWAINLFWLLPISSLVFLHPRYALLGLLVAYLPLLYLAQLTLGWQKRVA